MHSPSERALDESLAGCKERRSTQSILSTRSELQIKMASKIDSHLPR